MNPALVAVLEGSRQLGYLGPGPVEPHIDHAGAFAAAATEPPARALDLGAGGGLPGLVLAADHWPDTRWTFLDAQAKRTEFLRDQVAALGLEDRVEVVTARAEEAGRDPSHRAGYDLVVARSFAAPPVTAECSAPLLTRRGWLLVSEPPAGDLERRWPTEGLRLVGFGPPENVLIETASGPVHLMHTQLMNEPGDQYPRRVGIPAKRPLY